MTTTPDDNLTPQQRAERDAHLVRASDMPEDYEPDTTDTEQDE